MVWGLITDFGDSAAMLPAAVLLFGWLALNGQGRAAVLWAGLFMAESTVVAATKIAFRGWGIGLQTFDFTGISGHATLACSMIPIALAVIVQRAGPSLRAAALAAGLAAGALIGVSRVALAQHSWSEALAGCALGGVAAIMFVAFFDAARRPVLLPAPLIAGALAGFLLLMHGAHAPSERILTRIALRLSGHSAPYTRWTIREPWALMQPPTDDLSATRREARVHPGSGMLRSPRANDRG